MKKTILFLFLAVSVISKAANPIYLGNLPKLFGLDFGCSYEYAKTVLNSKYGEPYNLLTSSTEITYKSISYGGFFWDTVSLFFQREGNKSFLNRIIFCSNPSRDIKHIKNIRDDIYNVISTAYQDSFLEYKDEKGFKYYYGGPDIYMTTEIESVFKGVNNENLMPLGSLLITISIVHFDDGDHSAKLDYGTIPFVDEGF